MVRRYGDSGNTARCWAFVDALRPAVGLSQAGEGEDHPAGSEARGRATRGGGIFRSARYGSGGLLLNNIFHVVAPGRGISSGRDTAAKAFADPRQNAVAGKGLRHPYLEPPGELSRAPGKRLPSPPSRPAAFYLLMYRHDPPAVTLACGWCAGEAALEPGRARFTTPRYRGARLPRHLRRAGEAVSIHDRNIDLHGIGLSISLPPPALIINGQDSLTRNAVLIECRPSPTLSL